MFQFRDDKDENRSIVREINSATERIAYLSNAIQMRNQCIAYLVMINDWYIQDNDDSIGRARDDAEQKHLEDLYTFFDSYADQLAEIDECLKQVVDILSGNFDYEDDDIQKTIRRVEKDL
jgi:hypothetical protein